MRDVAAPMATTGLVFSVPVTKFRIAAATSGWTMRRHGVFDNAPKKEPIGGTRRAGRRKGDIDGG